jgi:hypothetical protein
MWYYDIQRDVWHILALTLPHAMGNAKAHWDESSLLLHLIGTYPLIDRYWNHNHCCYRVCL